MGDLDVYLDTLFDGLQGLVYSPAKVEITKENPAGWETNWFEWPKQKDELVAHVRRGRGDIYISPAVYSERRGTKDAIKKIQTVWVDFDGTDRFLSFKDLPDPSLIVQTSASTKVHCYWRVEPSDFETIEETSRRLTYYLEADNGGWDSTQLLRPPETLNHKYEEFGDTAKPVVLSSCSRSKHKLIDFDYVPQVKGPSITVVPENLISFEQILRNFTFPMKLLKMLKIETPVEPHRSGFLARLANELAEEGLGHTEVVSLLKYVDGRIKKFEGRNDQLLRLSQIADYAIHKHIAEDEIVLYSFDDILHHVDDLDWVIPGVLHGTGFLIISSAPGVGKTQWICQLAYCLDQQERFMGWLPTRKQKCLIMSLEMDVRSLKYIIGHQSKEHKAKPSVVVLDETTPLVKYEDIIEQQHINTVLIDSASELTEKGEDGAAAEALRLLKWIKKIRRRYGVSVVLIHHNRKATEGNKKPKSLADLADSYHFGRVAESVLQLWKDHKGMELSAVKVRFGPDFAFMVQRNKNLWFTRIGTQDVSDGSTTTGTDTPRSIGFKGIGFRHGDQLH